MIIKPLNLFMIKETNGCDDVTKFTLTIQPMIRKAEERGNTYKNISYVMATLLTVVFGASLLWLQ